jgi:hypothetical protein
VEDTGKHLLLPGAASSDEEPQIAERRQGNRALSNRGCRSFGRRSRSIHRVARAHAARYRDGAGAGPAESLATLLKIGGHEVHLAHDGLQAVKSAMDLQPDVVLLDIGCRS